MTTTEPTASDPAASLLARILFKAEQQESGVSMEQSLGQEAIDKATQSAGADPEQSAAASGAGGDQASPVPAGAGVSGKFGEQRGDRAHGGIDLTVPVGTTINAATSGTVTSVGGGGDGGNTIVITGMDGTVTRYMHLSTIGVAAGAPVKAGQPIGKSGGAKGAPGAGNSTGAHLHFEVSRGGQNVDPTPWLAGGAQMVAAEPGEIQMAEPDVAGVAGNVIDKAAGRSPGYDPETSTEPTQSDTGEVGSDPDQWIRKAMAATGVDESWFAPLKARMMQESGGRNIPQGIQDVNTAKGTPAFGPMQVIEPTFRAHAMKGHEDWQNPVDNTIAAIRYILSRYGHPSKLPKGGY